LAKKIWTIWKYALGSFNDDKTSSYDNVIAITRTFIFVSYLITNCFIISGVIRHWNSMQTKEPEILELQKQVDKLLEEYRQEEYKKKDEPVGDPSY